MNKKILVPILVITIGIIVSILIIESFSQNNQPNVRVSYVRIQSTSPGWRLYFGISNDYNSPITTIGYSVDELLSDTSNADAFRVQPGQHLDSYFYLGGNVLSFSHSYNVTLTFTFEDGKHVSYSMSVTPEK